MNILAREAAGDYYTSLLLAAFESVTLDEIEEAFSVDTGEAMAILFEMGQAQVALYWEDEIEDELADALPGDADPTMLDIDVDTFDGCYETEGTFRCTREKFHPGQHVAGDGIEVCAVWL